MKKISDEITVEKLREIYYENDVKDAAKKLGISISCLFTYLKEFKIPLKGRGGNKRKKLRIVA